ncbi:MAG: hypothetical protein KBG28_02125 [Kofleriaceae bacterium]|jgi:hypothetical protein|nr:hypothetical protein [Kofleriaceae bacterium]MBP6840481.1 hypothetical protein [Kofleriaceae bacterium]MBP9202753.1 hypothetical protein [Kofleriaceae bacterium]
MAQPLVPATPPARPGGWAAAHVAGLLALVLGVVGFMVVALTADKFWATPDWRLTVPFFVATVAAAVVSLVRREGTPALPLLGLGLAGAAMVLGWFLITAIVIGVTAVIILILSTVM